MPEGKKSMGICIKLIPPFTISFVFERWWEVGKSVFELQVKVFLEKMDKFIQSEKVVDTFIMFL